MIDKRSEKILIFIFYVFCKFLFDYGFVKLVAFDIGTYHPCFVFSKYVIGWVFCLLLFFPINLENRKVSSFFLAMILVLQLLPITTIYAFCDGDSFFYYELCMSFLLCEIIVRYAQFDDDSFIRNKNYSNLFVFGLFIIAAISFAYMVSVNGVPSLTALNIYNVYSLRSSSPAINKIVGYTIEWTMFVIMPIALSWSIQRKKYYISILLIALVLLMYLYTGNKTQLFSILLVIACTIFSSNKKPTNTLLIILMVSIIALSVIAVFLKSHLIEDVYSLIIRRCCFVPALNKFSYYDYFSSHPKLGIYGIFPTWIVPYDGYYLDVPYSYEISRIYYGKPAMNSSTGFLVEGFARFGHLGTVFEMIIFALIIKLFDSFQSRTSYQTSVGFFSYIVFSLCDMFLFNSLILGSWMIVVFVFLSITQRIK